MRARDLVRPYPMLSAGAPAAGAVQRAAATSVRSFLVVDPSGALIGVLSNTDILRAMLPSYLEDSPSIAGVIPGDQEDLLWKHGSRKRVGQVAIPDAAVAPDATLLEVMSVMVSTRASLVGVVAEGRLLGGISLDQVLDSLSPPPMNRPG
jgi:CBS domain-containing protein